MKAFKDREEEIVGKKEIRDLPASPCVSPVFSNSNHPCDGMLEAASYLYPLTHRYRFISFTSYPVLRPNMDPKHLIHHYNNLAR